MKCLKFTVFIESWGYCFILCLTLVQSSWNQIVDLFLCFFVPISFRVPQAFAHRACNSTGTWLPVLWCYISCACSHVPIAPLGAATGSRIMEFNNRARSWRADLFKRNRPFKTSLLLVLIAAPAGLGHLARIDQNAPASGGHTNGSRESKRHSETVATLRKATTGQKIVNKIPVVCAFAWLLEEIERGGDSCLAIANEGSRF